MTRTLLTLAALILLNAGCAKTPMAAPETKPGSTSGTAAADTAMPEDDKTFFALGMAIANSLEQFALTDEEFELVKSGLIAGATGEETDIDLEEYSVKIGELSRSRAMAAAELEKTAAAAFTAEMAAMDGAQQFDSGLIMIELTPGDGPGPAATDTVKVHYHGTLRDGTVFDSSVDRGQPAEFPLNRVIACWTEGVQKMKVGGKSRLICPASIAYGDRGSPPKIKPGATLVFEVELLSIGQETGG